MSSKKWFSIKKIVRNKKAPASYYVIRGIIWKHINRMHPKLFLGKNNLQDVAIADIPAWLVTKDHEMGPKLLSWLNPGKKHEPLSFYEQTERISTRNILKMLQEADSQNSAHFYPMSQLSLFDTDPAVFVDNKFKASDICTKQQVKSAIYLAA